MNCIQDYKPPVLIAEIGCNHKGDISIAKEMITLAKLYCKADIVKFQKRNIKEMLTEEEYNSPHPNPKNSYGKTYGEHREFLEFSAAQHKELIEFCDQIGIVYSTSVWDLTSAKEIASLNPKLIKIPSALSNHFEVLKWLCDNYPGEIHLSLGMTTKQEIESIVRFFVEQKRNKDLVLYHCTSGYPITSEEACLLEIANLRREYGALVKDIGYSGHHNGIVLDIAAYTLGGNIIERHFTLDKTWKGTDHSASLEPDEMKILKSNLMEAYKALAYKRQDLLEVEKVQRRKLKWSRNQESAL